MKASTSFRRLTSFLRLGFDVVSRRSSQVAASSASRSIGQHFADRFGADPAVKASSPNSSCAFVEFFFVQQLDGLSGVRPGSMTT
jgi:hypothetical protein